MCSPSPTVEARVWQAQRQPAFSKERQVVAGQLAERRSGGRSPSSLGGPGRAWNPLAWGPAQRRPPRALEGATRLRRRRQARAERLRGGCSPSPPGEARGGQGAHPGGVRPSAGLRGSARCRREGQAAKASPGQGRAGEEAAGGWGGGRPGFAAPMLQPRRPCIRARTAANARSGLKPAGRRTARTGWGPGSMTDRVRPDERRGAMRRFQCEARACDAPRRASANPGAGGPTTARARPSRTRSGGESRPGRPAFSGPAAPPAGQRPVARTAGWTGP